MGTIMRARRAVLLLLPALLAACGGSGSSGFDPAGFEGPLIERAIVEQRCIDGDDGLIICPSGAAVPEPAGGLPNPGAADLRISASVADGAVDCRPDEAACTLAVAVGTENLPQNAELRLAARIAPDGRWQLGAPLPVAQFHDGTGTLGPVPLGLAGELAPGEAIQVAVLLFVPPPGELPGEVAELRETGALYAFVLQPSAVTSR